MTDVSEFEREIAPPGRWVSVDWKELVRYKDLFLVFSWRDLSVRYKQTALGVLWAVFQPFISMIVFTFVFNRVANIQSGDKTPYPVFLYVGLLFWLFYSGTLTKASESMVVNANIVQKVYFPRLIIPASTVITGLVDMGLGAIILGVLMVYFHFAPHLMGLVLLPVLVLDASLTALGVGLLMAAVNLKYRDVRYALPFIIQILMYVTPVIYPVKMLDSHPEIKSLMLWLNPISGVISTARSSFFGQSPVDWTVLAITTGMSFVAFVCGLYYFRATERYFADIV